MNEMIERCARALCEKREGWRNDPGFIDRQWRLHVGDVELVIRTMREPTEAMIEPGALAGEMYGNTDSKATWRAMIGEALK